MRISSVLVHRLAVAVTSVGLVLSVAVALSANAQADTTPPPPLVRPGDTAQGKPEVAKLRGKVNLNTATGEELQRLPGIGVAKATRILTWRARRGRFERIKDLRRVKGFGRKTVAKLRPYLTLEGPTTLGRESSEADGECPAGPIAWLRAWLP